MSFISSTARGLHSGKRLRGIRADREREFLQAWRAGQNRRDSKRGTRAYIPVIATLPIFNIRTRFCNTSEFRCILSFPPRPSFLVGAADTRIPGELRSPAPASDETMNSCETPHARPRHKRRTLSVKQTFRFNVPISAFFGVSAKLYCSAKRAPFPAPTFPQSGRAGYSRRGCKFAPANLAPSLRG